MGVYGHFQRCQRVPIREAGHRLDHHQSVGCGSYRVRRSAKVAKSAPMPIKQQQATPVSMIVTT
jgi:hypothetical protein